MENYDIAIEVEKYLSEMYNQTSCEHNINIYTFISMYS